MRCKELWGIVKVMALLCVCGWVLLELLGSSGIEVVNEGMGMLGNGKSVGKVVLVNVWDEVKN